MIYWCATALVLFLLSWCALFYFFISLQVLYLDSLETGFKRISTRGCRVSVWTTKLVRKAIAKDTKPDGSFGALQVCHFVNYIHFPFFSFVIFFILYTKPFLSAEIGVYWARQHPFRPPCSTRRFYQHSCPWEFWKPGMKSVLFYCTLSSFFTHGMKHIASTLS